MNGTGTRDGFAMRTLLSWTLPRDLSSVVTGSLHEMARGPSPQSYLRMRISIPNEGKPLNLGRMIARDLARQARRQGVYGRMQAEAASHPESKQVQTSVGQIWMSPIEVQLYDAMRQEGLDPIPQFYIQGYYADFAFPDVQVAVEADGAVHDDVAHHRRDRKRDWIMGRAGWTVKRFHGTTIYHKAANCAYVVRREVEGRRAHIAQFALERELRRQARRTAIRRPFQILRRLLTRAAKRQGGGK